MDDARMRKDTNLTGAAGEHLVAAMLCRLGWAASITPQGYKGIDILAVSEERGGDMIQVQVKAAEHGSTMWMDVDLDQPPEAPANAWCVLVSFSRDALLVPDFFVLPLLTAKVFAWARIADAAERAAERGRTTKRQGRGGLKARDFEGYRNRWDLLGREDALELPYAFTGDFWSWPRPDGIAVAQGELPPAA